MEEWTSEISSNGATGMQEQSIFSEALEKGTPAERAAFLDEACESNVALRSRIERLLERHAQTDGFLATPALTVTVDEPVAERSGMMIGRYKLMEQIGEGGMGLVFVAEQQQPVRRKVALKVIKPGMDSRAVIARFEAERQALAVMDHPNIAKVLDAGTTESGRPFFVMELVRDGPITRFCDDRRMAPRERLELFVHVCQAVQHAHLKGIIHRDIKTSNILVTLHDGKPVVKVIDFGIAKAIGQQLTDKTVYTRFTQMIGTPMYMSPEQAEMSGLDVDTRTDIYSLGVLLYELLTGTTPCEEERLRTAGFDEMRRIIRDEEPVKPSTRVSTLGPDAATVSATRQSDPKRLSRLFRGDLDWVVMKALEKDRNRRYESASGFAADIERYLHDEPVLACPPSAFYRFRKFARRHTAALSMTAALAAAMLVAVGSLISAVNVLAASNAQIKEEQTQTNTALGREKQANDDLTRTLEEKLRSLYFHRVALAERELAASREGRAEELLDECPVSLRSWERGAEPITFRGHSAWVWRATFSPDGQYVASAGGIPLIGEIKIWKPTTGEVVRTLRSHIGPVIGVAFSPDGQRLASAGWDRTIKVWEVATGTLIRTQSAHRQQVLSVEFSPDGKLLASASADRTIKLWDAASGQELRTLQGHTDSLTRVTFSPDGKHLASAGFDTTVRLWDTATGQAIHVLRGHTGPVFDVNYSRDGQRIASTGGGGRAMIWNATNGEHIRTIRVHIDAGVGIAFSADGRRLASSSVDKNIKLWDVESGEEVLTIRGHDDAVMSVTFSPNGQQLVSASIDGTAKVWDINPNTAQPSLMLRTLRGHNDTVVAVAYGADGKFLASASLDQTVRLWDATSGAERHILSGPVYSLSFSRDGRRLATVGFTDTVRIWDAATGNEVRAFPNFGPAVALSPNGDRLAAGLDSFNVRIWNVESGREEFTLPEAEPLTCMVFSPDGAKLASSSLFGTVKIRDLATRQVEHNLRGHRHYVQTVVYSRDGKRFATASWDKTARVWDAATGKELLTLTGHQDRVRSVAFSPDGKYLATASLDHAVKIWDATTGKAIRTLRGTTGYVGSVAFSADGKNLATGGGYNGKGEVKIWDATRFSEKAER